MERRVDLSNLDLDRAAELIAARRAGWLSRGLKAAALTWMDIHRYEHLPIPPDANIHR
ncbi:hypothetical protein ACIG56_33505 [Nocardia fusca]|uniref:hypothetical protein n=1 Tax=Nocardia fusca TaxID=941183 RepID=UPI0037C67333